MTQKLFVQPVRIVIKRSKEFPDNCAAYISTDPNDAFLNAIVMEGQEIPGTWEVREFLVKTVSISNTWIMNATDVA